MVRAARGPADRRGLSFYEPTYSWGVLSSVGGASSTGLGRERRRGEGFSSSLRPKRLPKKLLVPRPTLRAPDSTELPTRFIVVHPGVAVAMRRRRARRRGSVMAARERVAVSDFSRNG